MPDTDIGSTTVGDLATETTDYSVAPVETEAVYAPDENYIDFPDWSQNYGYYKEIPELRSAINTVARWTIGKGYKTNEITDLKLSTIRGYGKDTFNSILRNLVKCRIIGRDSFAEIIRDSEGELVNLKPLDTGSMRIVYDSKGMIKRYEQVSKVQGKDMLLNDWQPEDIFHLCNDRIADEVRGQTMIDAVEGLILMRNEAMQDYKKLLHRNVQPIKIHHLDTDNQTEINNYIAKADEAYSKGENLYIPKGIAEIEISAVPSNATLNPQPWIKMVTDFFYQAYGVPMIVVGGSQEITEASAKMAYLAWEQTIEEEQLYIEEQILAQLNLEINLEFPATIRNEILTGMSKSETMQATTPEDTSVQGVPLEGVEQ